MKRMLFIPLLIFTVLSGTAQHHFATTKSSDHSFHEKVQLVIHSFQQTVFHEMPKDGPLTGEKGDVKIFEGFAKKHRLHGNWQSWYLNGQMLDSGRFLQGIPDGQWKYWDSAGRLLSIRHYDAEKLQRVKEEMRLAHPKRTAYPITNLYKKNKQVPLYHLLPAYAFAGHGSSTVSRSFSQLTAENSSGNHGYHPAFNECLHNGLFMNFFPGGIIRDSGYHKNGLKHGVWLHRLSSGGVYYIGAYHNGIPHKEWKEYDAQGRLLSVIFFNRKGEQAWQKDFRR